MTVRLAKASDAAVLAELMTQLGYPTTPGQMAQRMRAVDATGTHATFVAERNGEVIGMAGASVAPYYEKDGTYCRLLAIAVLDGHRGEGIGVALVDAVEKWARERGAGDVIVNSGHHRAEAHAFYERCDYRNTGARFVKRLD